MFYKNECSYLRCGTAVLFLNMNSESAVFGFAAAVRQGFKFGGFDPLCGGGEFVVMYYGQDACIFLSEIKTAKRSEFLLSEVLKIGEEKFCLQQD